MERWSLILAETPDEPSEAFLGLVPGARRIWDRLGGSWGPLGQAQGFSRLT